MNRLSPSFVRLELGSPALADFVIDCPRGTSGSSWSSPRRGPAAVPRRRRRTGGRPGSDLPGPERGHMRTYTVRAVRRRRVRHPAGGRLRPPTWRTASTGPGATWAARANQSDRLIIVAPRKGMKYGGINFDPGTAPESCCWWPKRPRCRRSAASSRTCRHDAVGRRFGGAHLRRRAERRVPRASTSCGWPGTGHPRVPSPTRRSGALASPGPYRSRSRRSTPTFGIRPRIPPRVRTSTRRGHGRTRPRRALCVDRRGVRGGDHPASGPGERARGGPPPGGLHGLLATGCRDAGGSSELGVGAALRLP